MYFTLLRLPKRTFLLLFLFLSGAPAGTTNVVANGNFAGGTQEGPGTDTVANGWYLLPATDTAFQVENIGGVYYAAFMSTASAQDLAGGNMNGIGVSYGQPDMDCLYQSISVIAGQQYSVSFSVKVTGAIGNNTLMIPQWNWDPQVGQQINMMDPLYGSFNAVNQEWLPATGTGSVLETFTETAPVGPGVAAGSPETIYLMFHGSDGTGGAILLSNVVVTPASVPPPPSIFSGGVVPVNSTSVKIEAGEWVSIFGANLASGNVTWTGTFQTSLGGTSVTIDGKPAYLSFVSAGQVNVQAPNDSATGAVPVVVTTPGGSVTSTVTLAEFAPSLLLLDSVHVAALILRSNGSGAYGGGTYDIVGPTGTSLGYPTVAAKAGDTVELFGTGFGPTNPSVPAGQTFTGAAPLTSAIGLSINGASVTPSFAGLSGAGLDQVNFVVPAGLGTGDVPIQLAVGGAQAPSGVVISLQ